MLFTSWQLPWVPEAFPARFPVASYVSASGRPTLTRKNLWYPGYLAMGIVLDFVCKFFLISQKKEPSGVGYPLVWCIVKQLFTELSMKSGRNFAHGFQTNHLSFVYVIA